MQNNNCSTEDQHPSAANLNHGNFESIAVIGFAHKFPQDVTSADGLWNLLLERRTTMTEVPINRWNIDGFYRSHGNRPSTVKNRGGHFLTDHPGRFDAPFFSITPAEAECMDPQQRFLLETSYHALENAGISMKAAMGSRTSVHVGCLLQEYSQISQRDAMPGTYQIIGSSGLAMLANRVSWFYDLKGPSMTIDTACSGSLVALHLACQELQSGSVSMALACGSNLCLLPDSCSLLSQLNMMSPDSVCHSFDERANGYAKSEGFGVLVLKRFSQAVQDGDTIRAVIRATGCNSDGRTPSITSPSQKAQEKLIRDTYRRGGLSLDATRFFEAHGTGTPVGDPCEASTISNVFTARTPTDPMFVGALKSNLGHSEGASGVAGVIKTILALERGIIPPNVYERVNPAIASSCQNLSFPSSPVEWPSHEVRRASVNAFGYGGTNAHVVIDDAFSFLHSRGLKARHCTRRLRPRKRADSLVDEEKSEQPVHHLESEGESTDSHLTIPNEPAYKLLVLSAFDESAVQRSIQAQTEWFRSRPSTKTSASDLSDVAHTLSQNRTSFPWKAYCIAGPQPPLDHNWSSPTRSKQRTSVCFVFTGQGAQWHGMGRELLRFPVFRDCMAQASEYFESLGSSWSMLDELYKHPGSAAEIDSPNLSQPLCTALQIAMVELLKSWNINPSTVVGHSSGEIAAAYACGAISRDSAWMIAYLRGLAVVITRDILQSTGAMVAVQSAPESLNPILDSHNEAHPTDMLTIACYNSPLNLTVSGSRCAVDRITHEFSERKLTHRLLKVDVAYHSQHMEPVAMVYNKLLRSITPGEQHSEQPVFVSTVTGKPLGDSATLRTPGYWIENLTLPVRFSATMMRLVAHSFPGTQADFFVELGPHSTLRSPIREMLSTSGRSIKTDYCAVLHRGRSAHVTALECAGSLHAIGIPVDISQANDDAATSPKMLTTLPSYPFSDKTKYWLEGRTSKQYRFREHLSHELLGTRSDDWNPHEARWTNRIVLDQSSYLMDHQINGVVLLPAAGMLAMAIEAVRQFYTPSVPVRGYKMKEVTFSNSITISSEPHGTEVQLTLRPSKSSNAPASDPASDVSWSSFSIYVYESAGWNVCCSGAIAVDYLPGKELEAVGHDRRSDEELKSHRLALKSCQVEVDSSHIYNAFEKAGLVYGPRFRALQNVREMRGREATGTVDLDHWKLDKGSPPTDAHLIHPATLDAILQISFPAYSIHAKNASATTLPTGFRTLWIAERLASAPAATQTVTVHGKVSGRGFRNKTFAITAAMADTDELCFSGTMETTTIGRGAASSDPTEPAPKSLYRIQIRPDIDLRPRGSRAVEDTPAEALSSYLDTLAHKYPHIRVLELCAETGGRTALVLEALQGRFAEYLYTDVDSACFSEARERFASAKMAFTTLDYRGDWAGQGVEEESFDLLVAPVDRSSVVSDRDQLLRYRRLLRRQGRVVLFARGRRSGDEVARDLDQELIDAGFSGIEIQTAISGLGSESEASAVAVPVVVSTALSLPVESRSNIHIVFDQSSTAQGHVLQELKNALASRYDMDSTAVPWGALNKDQLQDSICIFLPSLDHPILDPLNEESLGRLKNLVSATRTLLWISCNTHTMHRSPIESLVPGLVRTLATEAEENQLVSVSLDVEKGAQAMSTHIVNVAGTFLQPRAVYEDEYVEINGTLHIPRVVDDKTMAVHVAREEQCTRTLTKPWSELEHPRLSIQAAGHLHTLYYEESGHEDSDLGPGDVLVEVKAAGLRDRDVLVALGQVHDDAFGTDIAGIVRRVREPKEHGFQVGDWVFGVTKSGMAQVARCKGFQLQRMPPSMSFVEAASCPAAYCTAYHGLVNCARMEKNETVLIHDGVRHEAGIQMAQLSGCSVIATVNSVEEQAYLLETYGIAESLVLSSSAGLSQRILRLQDGRRIDVVLTSTTEGAASELWDCVAPFGRFIEITESDVFVSTVNAAKAGNKPASKNNRLSIRIDFQELMQHDVLGSVFGKVAQLLQAAVLRVPKQVHVFKQSEIEAAFRTAQQGANGPRKVVVEMVGDEMVPMEITREPKPLFDGDSTYLVAGAFGGIGESVTRWMVRNGARHLVLPSRCAVEGTQSSREQIVHSLRAAGATVRVPLCDIANRAQLESALREADDMPRIRGCIQAAMVLQDSSFSNMTAEKWNTVLAPKVAGSWNLHDLLPTDLDFFIMMSSSTGIMGSFGQSNYTAGNTYQDGLAAHRIKHGQRAVALAFSMVVGVGYVAQNAQVQALLRVRGMLEEVTLKDIYALLAFCCDTERVDSAQLGPQIITSLTLPADLRAMNIVAPLGSTRPLYAYLDTLPSHYDEAAQQQLQKTKTLPSSLLPAATTLADAVAIITEAIQNQLSSLLVVSQDDIDTKHAVHKYGVDSLVAVEMKNWFAKGVGADVSTMEIMGELSIGVLAGRVATRSRFVKDELKA